MGHEGTNIVYRTKFGIIKHMFYRVNKFQGHIESRLKLI